MDKKNFKKIIMALLLLVSCLFIKTLTVDARNSAYIEDITEEEVTELLGGVRLHKQIVRTLYNGDETRGEWNPNTVQWVDVKDPIDSLRVVSYGPNNESGWSLSTPTSMAKDYERKHPGWIVIAGVNGDFYKDASSTNTKEPTNVFVEEGRVIRPNGINAYHRGVFAVRSDGTPFMGLPEVDQNLTLHSGNNKYVIDKINDVTNNPNLVLITQNNVEYDLTGYEIYYGKINKYRLSDENSIYLDGDITEVKTGGIEQISQSNFIIASKQTNLLKQGDNIYCQQDLMGDWSDVESTIGFNYYVVEDGEAMHQKDSGEDSHVYIKYPRTLVGYKEDGSVIMMAVDGKGSELNNRVGVSLFEAGELMKEAGATYACNFDSGGSVNLFVRTPNGTFEMINTATDGSERAVANALFFVMRDPTLDVDQNLTSATTLTLKRKTDSYSQNVTDIKITLDGKTYDFNSDQLTITNLKENTVYNATVEYMYEGEKCYSQMQVKTKEYTPKFNFTPKTYGFIIERVQTDDVLRLKSVNFEIDGKSYQMGDVDTFEISGLQKGTKYSVNYTYEIENINTKETFTKKGEEIDVETLSYSEPEIIEFKENRRTSDYIRVEYEYTDKDKLINRAYILVNEEKYPLSNELGSLKIDNLDLENGNYKIVLVLEYTVNGRIVTKESEPIIIGNAEHEHVWQDATCESPKKCKICDETEGEPLGHNFENGVCTRCGETDPNYQAPKKGCNGCKKNQIMLIISLITIFTSLGLIVRKKH